MSVKYSKKVVYSANRFLAEYNLMLEQLTEAQQKFVIRYIRIKKTWLWIFLCFLIAIIGIGCSALGEYLKIQEFVGKAVILSDSGTEIDWQKVCGFSFEQGFLLGCYIVMVVIAVVFFITVPVEIHNQKRLLDAFLPSLAPKSANESHKQV